MFLIVSGGDAPDSAFLRERAGKARMIIAADKGAQFCLNAGIRPDVVVGDMDSVSKEALEEIRKSGVRVDVCGPEKDQTDTLLALEIALKSGASSIEMIACIGDRIDHSLANVHLLYAARARGAEAVILSPRFRIFLVDSRSCLSGMRGCTVSLLPLTMEAGGITLTGFRWPLKDASMKLGDPYGISNRVISDEACIEVRTGVLIGILFFREALEENG